MHCKTLLPEWTVVNKIRQEIDKEFTKAHYNTPRHIGCPNINKTSVFAKGATKGGG
jgi:hypothetical protein